MKFALLGVALACPPTFPISQVEVTVGTLIDCGTTGDFDTCAAPEMKKVADLGESCVVCVNHFAEAHLEDEASPCWAKYIQSGNQEAKRNCMSKVVKALYNECFEGVVSH